MVGCQASLRLMTKYPNNLIVCILLILIYCNFGQAFHVLFSHSCILYLFQAGDGFSSCCTPSSTVLLIPPLPSPFPRGLPPTNPTFTLFPPLYPPRYLIFLLSLHPLLLFCPAPAGSVYLRTALTPAAPASLCPASTSISQVRFVYEIFLLVCSFKHKTICVKGGDERFLGLSDWSWYFD